MPPTFTPMQAGRGTTDSGSWGKIGSIPARCSAGVLRYGYGDSWGVGRGLTATQLIESRQNTSLLLLESLIIVEVLFGWHGLGLLFLHALGILDVGCLMLFFEVTLLSGWGAELARALHPATASTNAGFALS